MLRLSLGATADLEASPLVDGLDQEPWRQRVRLVKSNDALQLASELDDESMSGALLPTHLLPERLDRVEIVPGIAIGSEGSFPAAILAHRVPLADVRSIASPIRGHTAEMLCRVLFLECGLNPHVERWNGPHEDALESHDALLLAGDAALLNSVPDAIPRVDLGNAWTELTGLPFVWSVWAAQPGAIDRSFYALLHTVRSRGRQYCRSLARRFAEVHGAEREPLALNLLTSIRFRLGRRQVAGLEAFWSAAERHGLSSIAAPLRFVPLSAGTSCQVFAEQLARRRQAGGGAEER